MKAGPPISVIIPTYRREQVLCHCLTCVLHQDYASLEVIVVDQTEKHQPETERFLSEIAHRIGYYRHLEPNPSVARNLGLAKSRGEIVVFLDDDALLAPDFLSRLVRHYESPDVAAVSGLPVAEGESYADALARTASRYGVSAERLKTIDRLPVPNVDGIQMSFRRDVCTRVGGFDEQLIRFTGVPCGEDRDYCERVSKAGYALYLDPGLTLIHQHQSPGGCGIRFVSPSERTRAFIRAAAYLAVKHRERGIGGWLRALWWAYHGQVLNRATLREGYWRLLRRSGQFLGATTTASRLLRSASRIGPTVLRKDDTR